MCDILYRAKRIDNKEWTEGDLLRETDKFEKKHTYIYIMKKYGTFIKHEVFPESVCKCLILDENKYCENDIYTLIDTIFMTKLTGILRFGRYEQDGSSGGYPMTPNIGFYFEVINWDSFEYKSTGYRYPSWHMQKTILEILEQRYGQYKDFKYIGNVFDNPNLLKDIRRPQVLDSIMKLLNGIV